MSLPNVPLSLIIKAIDDMIDENNLSVDAEKALSKLREQLLNDFVYPERILEIADGEDDGEDDWLLGGDEDQYVRALTDAIILIEIQAESEAADAKQIKDAAIQAYHRFRASGMNTIHRGINHLLDNYLKK